MLRTPSTIRSGLAGTLTVAVLTTLLLALASFQQAVAQDSPGCWDETTNEWDYTCGDTTPGEDGDNGDDGSDDGGGTSEPPCDLSLVEGTGHPDATRYCEGENACWANIPSEAFPDPEDWPSDPPTPDAIYTYKTCYGPDGEIVFDDWTWVVPEQPSIEDLAREAYGRLVAPDFTLAFSPPEESVIYIDTWWWAQGAPEGNIIGSSALGVRAVAEPSHLEVQPGDGSGTIECDFVTTEDDACTHTYERASGDGGYPARARLVYDVHFEQNGNPIELAGFPDTFESPWEETAVPVTEVQSNVVR
jgi:hypothetical protein